MGRMSGLSLLILSNDSGGNGARDEMRYWQLFGVDFKLNPDIL